MTDNDNDDNHIFNSPGFNYGAKLGVSIGFSDAVEQAKRARDMGEIDLWIDANCSKTLEGWKEWDEAHGGHGAYRGRWGRDSRYPEDIED